MNYSQKKKLDQVNKKIQIVRTQLFGKEANLQSIYSLPTEVTNHQEKISQPLTQTQSLINQDSQYLNQDLIKSFILASVVVGLEFLIYLGNTKGLVKF